MMRRILWVLALLSTTACGSDDSSPSAPSAPPAAAVPPTVASLAVTLREAVVRMGGTTQAAATATLTNGQTQALTSGFLSDTPAVATVSDSGLVTAVTQGRANIYLVHEGRQGLAQVLVPVRPQTIDFGAFSGFGAAPYLESGTAVAPVSGTWTFSGYGKPGPAVVFHGFEYMAASAAAEIEVTAGGSLFTFASVDLYSSVTRIPWEFTGFRNSVPVFTATGQQGNTFGNFVTTTNPRASDNIDRLVIKLTQPENTTCQTCARNPMGLDNIVIR
jgi:hypothetical protein